MRSHFYHFLLNREDIQFPGLPLNNKRDGREKWGENILRNSFKNGGWMIHNIIIAMRNVIKTFSMYIVLEDHLLVQSLLILAQ